ncbi:hypothetical protein BC828DRAFT_438146 [Blastocladiella britannica]|nr:hypothetical protein BC828DRAFT_438146 [Blastocladiella britannica]
MDLSDSRTLDHPVEPRSAGGTASPFPTTIAALPPLQLPTLGPRPLPGGDGDGDEDDSMASPRDRSASMVSTRSAASSAAGQRPSFSSSSAASGTRSPLPPALLTPSAIVGDDDTEDPDDLGDRAALASSRELTSQDPQVATASALLGAQQKLPYAALAFAASQTVLDGLDFANCKAVHVAVQAHGVWAHRLLRRVYARCGITDAREIDMVERLTAQRAGRVDPLDLAAALVPPAVLDRWRLERKREREEVLRNKEQAERDAVRALADAESKRTSRRKGGAAASAASAANGGAASSPSSSSPATSHTDGAAGSARGGSTHPKRSQGGKNGGGDSGEGTRSGGEEEDGHVPLPEYAALPGDNYYPDQPDGAPGVELAAPEPDSDSEVASHGGDGGGDGDAGSDSEDHPQRGRVASMPAALSPSPAHGRPSSAASSRSTKRTGAASITRRSRSRSTSSIPATGASPVDPDAALPPLILTREDVRHAVLVDFFFAATADGRYDARSRATIRALAHWLLLPPLDVVRVERHAARAAGFMRGDPSAAAREDFARDMEARSKRDRGKRLVAMAAAAVGGGLVLGLSAGLAAPLIGAGLGAAFTGVGLTGTTSFLSGTGGVALITTSATLTGSGVAQSKMAKRMGGVTDFALYPVSVSHRMNVLLTVGGWLAKTDEHATDLALPYTVVEPLEGDHFSLIWEPELLRELGSALKMIAGEVISTAVQQALMVTMLHGLLAALAWPLALLKIGYLIDNPWQNALSRAKKAGQLLADALVQQVQEGRPVSLIGYSLGARVIFYCLLELAQHKCYGVVDSVHLFGSPVTPTGEQWRLARSVVAGKFVNGYVSNDWILGFLFRATSVAWSVAGLAPARVPGIDDVDLTALVNGHLSYRVNMPRILRHVGIRVTRDDPEFLLNRDREAEHRIDEQARIAKEREAAEREARKRTGKASVIAHLQQAEIGHMADSLSVMSRVADSLGGEGGAALPPTEEASTLAAAPPPAVTFDAAAPPPAAASPAAASDVDLPASTVAATPESADVEMVKRASLDDGESNAWAADPTSQPTLPQSSTPVMTIAPIDSPRIDTEPNPWA